MPDWSRHRPYSELEPEHQRVIELALAHLREHGTGTQEAWLSFQAKARDPLSRLAELGLLRERSGRYFPSILALLYIEDAQADLDHLDAAIRHVVTSYRPDGARLGATEVARAIGISPAAYGRIIPFLSELSIGDEQGTIQPAEHHLRTPDLGTALASRRAQLHSRWMGAREGVQAPFELAITSIRATRFRALRELELPLRGLTVLVGPNGAGKSTVLDAISFLAGAVGSGLDEALSDQGGLPRLRTRGDEGPVELSVTFDLDRGDGRKPGGSYLLSVDELHGQVVVERERLELSEGSGLRAIVDGRRGRATLLQPDQTERTVYHPPRELVLHLPAGSNDVVHQFHDALSRVYLVERDPLVQTGSGAAWLSRGGVGERQRRVLVPSSMLSDLAADAAAVERLEAYVRPLLPALERIHRVVRTGAPTELEFEERGLPGRLRLDELSGGTRQLLLLAAIYLAPRPPAAVLVEEPDGGVHPGALPALADLLRSIARRTAVICTTHGAAFVETLDPERELVAIVRDGTGVRAEPLAAALRSKSWLRAFGGTADAFRRAASERP